MHDRHRTARAAGAELLAEDPRFAGCNRRVIKAARVDRDLVPVAEGRAGVERRRVRAWRGRDTQVCNGVEARTERVAKSAGEAIRTRRGNGAEQKRDRNDADV